MLIRRHIKPTLGHVLLTKLKPGELQQLYADKLEKGRTDETGGLSSQTVRHIHNVLHGALKQAMREGLVNRNVAQATSPPKLVRTEEMNPLSRKQVTQFLSTLAGERLEAAFLLDLATGLRRGELLALRWSDLNLERGTLQVRKSLSRVKQDDGTTRLEFSDVKTPKSRRLIPLPDEAVRELRAHKARQNQEKLKLGEAYQDRGMVFATVLGGPIEPRNFHRRWTELLKKAGIPHTRFHNLRHTFATILLEAGEHPKVVQEMLGHSKVSMTLDTYSHVVPGLKVQAAVTVNNILKEARADKAAR
jgi:integrase